MITVILVFILSLLMTFISIRQTEIAKKNLYEMFFKNRTKQQKNI